MIRFRRLHLRGYRRFREFSCTFGEGLNLIVGPNESGKSTLLNALLDALYANPFSTAQELRERVCWAHTGDWELELELLDGDECLCIRKRYVPDDPAHRSECHFLPHEGKQALQSWERYWGVPREVYLATACIRQRELSAIVADKKSLASLQQQLRENALMTDLERVLKQLQEQTRKLKERHDALQHQRETLTRQLHEAQTTALRQQEHRRRLHALAEQIEQNQQHIERERLVLEQVQSLHAQQSELAQARSEAERLRRVLDTLEQLDRDLQQLQHESAMPDSHPEALRTALAQRYETAQREWQAISAQLDRLTTHDERMRMRHRVRVGLSLAGVALVLMGVSLIPVNGLLGGTLIGLGGIALLLALLRRAPSMHEIELQREQLLQRLDHARQQCQQAQQRLQECERLLNQRSALLQAHDPDELRQQWSQLSLRIHALETQLSQHPFAQQLLDCSPEQWLMRQRQLQALQEEQRQLVEEKLRLEGALQQLHPEHDPDELRLQLQQLEEQSAYLQRRIELFQTTRDLLMEANRRYLSDLSPLLKPRVEAYLPALTCGRYTQVQLGDGLLFQVYHPDAGAWLDTDVRESGWSAGTLDQIFFACRLGLSDALTGDRRLPLLLDDPFLAFDEARLQSAMELLLRVAQHTQVLLFSCRAPNPLPPNATVITLPAPAPASP